MSNESGTGRLKAWKTIIIVYLGLYLLLRISGLLTLGKQDGTKKEVSVHVGSFSQSGTPGRSQQGIAFTLDAAWWIYTPIRVAEDTFWNKLMSRAEQVARSDPTP